MYWWKNIHCTFTGCNNDSPLILYNFLAFVSCIVLQNMRKNLAEKFGKPVLKILLISFLNVEVEEHDKEHTAVEQNNIAEHLNITIFKLLV